MTLKQLRHIRHLRSYGNSCDISVMERFYGQPCLDIKRADLVKYMSEIFDIRPVERGGFGIFRNDVLIIFNLDNCDVADFVKEQNTFGAKARQPTSAGLGNLDHSASYRRAPRAGPGRDLILGPYIGLFHDMMRDNPRVTAKQVERQLRSLGVKFSSITAVTNLARKHGLKLTA